MVLQVKEFIIVLRHSFKLLKRANPLILASSTAFFTTFSLSPIIIILVSVFSWSFKSDKLNNKLFNKIASTLGDEPTREIQLIVQNFQALRSNEWITFLSFIFFMFVATTLLTVVKTNIHTLWRIQAGRRIRIYFRDRVKQVCMILFTGLLFLLSLLMDSSLAISIDYLQTILPSGMVLIDLINIAFSLIIITIWFTMIFKLLPDAKVDWDTAISGGMLTASLFLFGKFVLSKILIHAHIASIFGASASIALLLLFIFYASFILYFGAAFTHEYAENTNKHICASKHAKEYEQKLIDLDNEN